MSTVEVDGVPVEVLERSRDGVRDVLARAVRQYLDQTHQPNHAVLISRRVEGRGKDFVRYDVAAQTDSPNSPRRRWRDFDVTILAGR